MDDADYVNPFDPHPCPACGDPVGNPRQFLCHEDWRRLGNYSSRRSPLQEAVFRTWDRPKDDPERRQAVAAALAYLARSRFRSR